MLYFRGNSKNFISSVDNYILNIILLNILFESILDKLVKALKTPGGPKMTNISNQIANQNKKVNVNLKPNFLLLTHYLSIQLNIITYILGLIK